MMNPLRQILPFLPLTVGLLATPAFAQPAPSLEPFNVTYLREDAVIPPDVITHTNISQTNLTVPSLWWANQQFGQPLVETWFAYPNAEQRRVDFVVNRQVWSLLDYLKRYEFLHHMGTVARSYGYNTRVFNRQGEALAAYTCDFNAPENPCDVRLFAAQEGLRGPRQSPLLPIPDPAP